MRSCSSPENSPSSLISPSTATVRLPGLRDLRERLQGRRHGVGAGVVGVVDDGDAARAAHAPPCASARRAARSAGRRRCRRCRRRACARTAAAARAFMTWCSPSTRKRTGATARPPSPSRGGRCSVNDGAAARSETTSVARTSARSSRPNQSTRAAVLSAIDATRGSSRLSTATSDSEQVGDHLGLRLQRRLDAAELAGVGEPDLEHDADVGSRHAHQAGDLADAARAHLGDEELRLLGHLEHRHRRADLVVERGARARWSGRPAPGWRAAGSWSSSCRSSR